MSDSIFGLSRNQRLQGDQLKSLCEISSKHQSHQSHQTKDNAIQAFADKKSIKWYYNAYWDAYWDGQDEPNIWIHLKYHGVPQFEAQPCWLFTLDASNIFEHCILVMFVIRHGTQIRNSSPCAGCFDQSCLSVAEDTSKDETEGTMRFYQHARHIDLKLFEGRLFLWVSPTCSVAVPQEPVQCNLSSAAVSKLQGQLPRDPDESQPGTYSSNRFLSVFGFYLDASESFSGRTHRISRISCSWNSWGAPNSWAFSDLVVRLGFLKNRPPPISSTFQ